MRLDRNIFPVAGRRLRPLIRGAVLLPLLASCSGEQSALDPKSPDAALIAHLWWAMLIVGTIILALVVALLLAAALRGRELGGTRGWSLVVAGGIVLPAAVILGLVLSGLYVGRDLAKPAAESDLTVEVVGRRWWWQVTYLDAAGEPVATTANEIHVPVGRDVRFLLKSDNVIHSFWVPNLQGKTDLIPGTVNETRLHAAEPGIYRGQCAEYCGVQHALMGFLVIAEEASEFDAWLERQARPASVPENGPAARGQQVFLKAGCGACHTVRGTRAVGVRGPDLTHLAGRRTLASATMPNTRGHLGGWVADPQSVKPGNLMPAVPIEAGDYHDLLAFLESLE